MRQFRGFSLIEVIVSIFIVGITLIILQAVIHSGTLVINSMNNGIALAIARNKIEDLRVDGYAALPPNGPFYDALLSMLPIAATTTFIVSDYNAKTKQILVSVVWLDSGFAASSTVSLATLITQTGGLQ